jgi:hypothetical protein
VSVPTPAHDAHTGVTESTEPPYGLGIVFVVGPDVDLNNPSHAHVAAVQARKFADWLDYLVGERGADNDAGLAGPDATTAR